jgi:hypothetical protein
LTADQHAVTHNGLTGLSVWFTIDFDKTVKTGTHHTKRAAGILRCRIAKLQNASTQQGGGDCITMAGTDRLRLKLYFDRLIRLLGYWSKHETVLLKSR